MSRIEFVGNALFIPYFLIGVGMMVDVSVIVQTDTIVVALNMLVIGLASKWIADIFFWEAWIIEPIR